MTNGNYEVYVQKAVECNPEAMINCEYAVIAGKLPASFRDELVPKVIVTSGKEGYKYVSKAIVHARISSVIAFRALFITFNILKERTGILSANGGKISLSAGGDRTFDWKWNLHAENNEGEARDHFASVAFIDKVVTKDNQVHTANRQAIVRALQAAHSQSYFSIVVTEADLNPDPERT